MTTTTPDRPSQPEASVGSLLAGRYRLDEQIGTGGMATVYRATDESLGRTVAIKLFRRDVADAADVRRQDAEVRLVASLSHPGVVTLFDAVADDEDNRAFLVLQHISGPDLRARLDEGPLDRATTTSIATDIADALAHVHARGVIHRDLKPANILVQSLDGRTTAMLTDFGIAHLVDGSRLTATGSVLGTAAFLSPEQALGSPLTPASDIYSLGLVLIECLTGERVFPGSGLESAAVRLSTDPPVPDDVSGAWQGLLKKMTAREPGDRPTAADVATRLRALSADEELEPTRRLPAIDVTTGVETQRMQPPDADATTERFTAAPDPVASPVVPLQSPATAPTHARRRPSRRALVGALVAVVAAATIGVTWWGITSQTPTGPTTTIEYPAVEGELGVSLEELQRSVEP